MAKNTDNAQTCRTCGALVDSEMTGKHTDWHEKLKASMKSSAEGAVATAAKTAQERRHRGSSDGIR